MDLLKGFILHNNTAGSDRLGVLLNECFPDVLVLNSIQNTGSVNDMSEEDGPDIVFIDIDSIDIMESEFRMAHSTGNYDTVFLLDVDERIIKVFEFLSIDFLRKPINKEELQQVLMKLRFRRLRKMTGFRGKELGQHNTERIALPHKKGYEFVDLDKVIRIEGDENYSKFYLEAGKVLLITKHLGTYEKLLDSKRFFRTHRKHMVNLDHVLSFERGKQGLLYMKEGHLVPLSYKRKATFLDRLREDIIF